MSIEVQVVCLLIQARSQVLCWGWGGGGGGGGGVQVWFSGLKGSRVPCSFAMANECCTLEFKCTDEKLQVYFLKYVNYNWIMHLADYNAINI